MKKLLSILLMFSLAVAIIACGGPTDEEIKAVRSVSFEGKNLTVTLGTNKSTGYEWDYEIFGDCVEPSIKRTFKVTGSKGDATGELSIGFEGVSEGAAVIVFATPNGWDGTGEGDGYTVNVVVGAGGKIEKANGMDGAFPIETSAPTETPVATPAETPAPTEAPTPVPAETPIPTPSGPKTTIAIDELAEGKYTGTLSGDSYSGTYKDGTYTISPDISKATITVTIADGKIKLYCKAKTTSGGAVLGVEAPRSPSFSRIVSGTLPLKQIDEATVGAKGDVSASEEDAYIYWNGDMKFDRWEIKTEEGSYHCTITIAMADGVPTAKIKVDGSKSHRKATVPLQLKGESTGELLSASYAEMLKSGSYQYSYPLTHQGIDFIATIAAKDGMACRKVISKDGAFNQRVLSKDGKAYQIDDLSGAVKALGAEEYETPPDYAGTLTFVAAKTLETGAVAEAYDFEYEGKPANVVFVFSEGKLVEFVTTVDGATAETFVTDMTGEPDAALFEMPQ